MNCARCGSFSTNSAGKFCPMCGAEKIQQAQVCQSEKKKSPAWAIALIAAIILLFLALCCVAAFIVADRQGIFDESISAIVGAEIDYDEEDRVTVLADDYDLYAIPTDEEIVAFFEDKHGVVLNIEWSGRDDDTPALKLRPINQSSMDFAFEVVFGDWSGNLFTLDEIKDGFLFALANSRIDAEVQLLAKDVLDAEMIRHSWADSRLQHSWHSRSLYQSVEWSPDEGIEAFRQAILSEMADELNVSFNVMLYESESIDDISWKQVEELVEKITASGYYGAINSLRIRAGWDSGSKGVDWRVQDGEVVSFERYYGL